MTGASIARHSAWARRHVRRPSGRARAQARRGAPTASLPWLRQSSPRPAGTPGHRAGGDAHLVVDDLVPERDPDVLERRDGAVGLTARDRDEEVEETRLAARRVVPDRVPAASKPRHDGFGHAGGERGRDSRVRGVPPSSRMRKPASAVAGWPLQPLGGRNTFASLRRMALTRRSHKKKSSPGTAEAMRTRARPRSRSPFCRAESTS